MNRNLTPQANLKARGPISAKLFSLSSSFNDNLIKISPFVTGATKTNGERDERANFN